MTVIKRKTLTIEYPDDMESWLFAALGVFDRLESPYSYSQKREGDIITRIYISKVDLIKLTEENAKRLDELARTKKQEQTSEKK